MSQALRQLAQKLGVAEEFWDWKGNHTVISTDTIKAVLQAMGIDAEHPESALAQLEATAWRRVVPACTVVEQGNTAEIGVHLPAGTEIEVTVVLEDGQRRSTRQLDNWTPDREIDGVLRGEASFELPGDLPLGYHRIEASGVEGVAHGSLIVAPTFVGFPPGMKDRRTWGYATQLYSVTSAKSWGQGDFVDLADLLTWAGRDQAGFVLVNPLHAPQSVPPLEPSPYLPASRRFLSPLYIRPEAVPEYAQAKPKLKARIKKLRKSVRSDGSTVDRDGLWAAKVQALRELFDLLRRPARQLAFDSYCQTQGQALRDFAIWSALGEVHGTDWRNWPQPLRDPRSEETAAFAADHADQVEFYQWLQWTAQQQLSAAQTAAQEAGMGVGIVADLAVGVSGASAETWLMNEVYAAGVTVGAPPDQYNQGGQDWGQPPWNPLKLEELAYEPFRAMVRAALNRVGGLRIDHIIGLFRLWWVPQGLGPVAGTYVRYNHDALVGILALEAYRAQALIVGEDLGTVEPWVREYLARRGLLGTAVLWWEYGDGVLLPPERWREYCMASVTTHDLPPTLGYLDGEHVRLRERLGLLQEPVADELAAAQREREMWVARLIDYGVLDPANSGDSVEVMLALHRYLGLTNSKVLVASLADAVGEKRAQNQPGTMDEYPNWRVPLADASGSPVSLEQLYVAELPRRVAQAMNGV